MRRSVRLVDGVLHRVRHPVGVHDHLAVDVAGRPTHGLDEARLRAQEALLVGVQDGDQRHLGQVEPLPQQVDADEDVELAEPQGAQDLDALDGVDVAVQVAHPQPLLEQVVGQVLGHLLGERGDEHAVALDDALVDLLDQVVDLALGGLDDHLGVDQAGGPHDLLDHLRADPQLVGAGRGRQEHHLVEPLHDLLEPQRTVVPGAGQPEPVLDERVLAAAVALVLAVELRARSTWLSSMTSRKSSGSSRAA